jgi:hypothetical protein
MAGIIYAVFIIFCAVLFLAWAAIPAFAVYRIVINFPN